METIYIVGIGMTKFGRHLNRSVKNMTAEAVSAALADAGIDRQRIGAAFFGNTSQGALEGQEMVRGQVALAPLGFQGIPVMNVENACATASTAFHMAVNYLRAGAADVALAVGAEKMVVSDKDRMFAIFEKAWDVETPDANRARLVEMGHGIDPPSGTMSNRPYSRMMDVYAAFARQHMRRHGMSQADLAAIAAKNHRHAEHNERAQYREPMTDEEVLAGAPITYPLTLPMCAPISDGAAAAVVCTESALARYGLDRSRAVRVLASVIRSAQERAPEDLANHVSRLAARSAYEDAGVGPDDVDLAEVHDATAMGELMQSEALGFCLPGEGGAFARSGASSIGGRLPINPSGGLESKGHPIGATGLGQIFELVTQLRGEAGPRQVEGARTALQENGGGIWGVEEAVAHIGIYGRA